MLKKIACLSVLVLYCVAPLSYAQETDIPDDVVGNDVPDIEHDFQNPGESNVTGKIANYFVDFAGGEEEAKALVTGLRNGDIVYVPPEEPDTASDNGDAPDASNDSDNGMPEDQDEDPEMPENGDHELNGQKMGYGNVFKTLALAEKYASMMVDTTAEAAINEILRMRQAEGMGWGEIAKAVGDKLGRINSDIRSGRGKWADATAQPVEPDADDAPSAETQVPKPEKLKKAPKEKSGHSVKPERPVEPEKVNRPVKPSRIAKPERPEKPVKPDKPQRPGRG